MQPDPTEKPDGCLSYTTPRDMTTAFLSLYIARVTEDTFGRWSCNADKDLEELLIGQLLKPTAGMHLWR